MHGVPLARPNRRARFSRSAGVRDRGREWEWSSSVLMYAAFTVGARATGLTLG